MLLRIFVHTHAMKDLSTLGISRDVYFTTESQNFSGCFSEHILLIPKDPETVVKQVKEKDEGANVNEGSQIGKSESFPVIEVPNDENDKSSGMVERNALDEAASVKDCYEMEKIVSLHLNRKNIKHKVAVISSKGEK